MKLKNEIFHRSFFVEKSAIDVDNRTVEIAFSSETPVQRSYGYEVLDHSPESVDLSRMLDGAPLLVMHDHDDQIGIVESARIDSDAVGRALVRFGNSQRANEIFQDFVDGIRRHISVGYKILDASLDKRAQKAGEPDTYRIKWMPFEVSSVSVPADNSVGVGRSLDIENEELPMGDQNKELEVNQGREFNEAEVRAAVLKDVRKDEQKRVADLIAIGERFNAMADARSFIENGKSVDELREVVLNNMEQRSEEQNAETHLDLSNNEVKQYSLVRAIRANVTGNWKEAGFELECSREISERLGKDPKGFFLPLDVANRATPMTVGTNADGGFLKGTDHLAGSFINNLRANSVILGSGARMLDGLVGDVAIPKKNGSAAFTWLAEDEDQTDDQVTLGQVTLSPKTVAGAVPMSRKLLKQSAPSVDAIVLEDLITGSALAIDYASIAGTGTNNQPTGILNQTGVLSQSIADAGNIPTLAELVGFETKVAEQNALLGSLRYLTTPTVNGGLKTTPKDAGSGIMLVEGGQANGYSVTATTQMPTGRTLFGNMNDVVIGMWGVLDIYADMSTKAASGGLVLRVFQDVDIAIRHAQSFCASA